MLIDHENIVKAMKKFYSQILNIKGRLVLKMETRYCKTEVLVAFWDKLLGHIHLKASELND